VSLPSPAALLLVAAVAAAVFVQGAFFLRGQLAVGALLAAAIVALLPVVRADEPGGRIALVAGSLLGAWAVARGVASGSLPDGLRTALLLAGLGAAILLCRRLNDFDRQAVVCGLIAIGVVVAALGWFAVAVHASPLALPTKGLWRAASTLTYANAAAGVLVPLALLTASLASARRSLPLTLALAMLLTGGVATLSRAGMIALAAGLLLLLILRGRALLRPLAAAVAGAAIALTGLLPSVPSRDAIHPALAVAALAAGLAITTVAVRTRLGPLLAGACVLLLALAVTGAVLGGAGPHLQERRATLDSPSRAGATTAALHLIAAHPLAGVGPGLGGVTTRTRRGTHVIVQQYIHDEYLQVLVEEGAIGGLLLAGLLAGLAGFLWRGRAHAPPELWAGVAAAAVSGAIAAAFDFLWHIPAVPLVLAVLIGLAATPATRIGRGPRTEGGSA
jgi:hypothetical protein